MAERWRNQARKLADTAAQADGPTDRTKNKILKITAMTTISQAARDAGEQLPWGHHVYPEVVARIIQDAIDAEKASETASLRQQLEEAKARLVINGCAFRDAEQEIKKRNEALNIALARVAELERERDEALRLLAKERDEWHEENETSESLRARVAELEAQCAAMRDALEKAAPVNGLNPASDLCAYCNQKKTKHLKSCGWKIGRAALSSTAGASLLAHVKELEKDKARMDEIEANTLTLKCCEDQGYDDADVHWEVIEYHMAEPKERMIGHGRTAREALSAAMAKGDA